jgi:hypothetical protein
MLNWLFGKKRNSEYPKVIKIGMIRNVGKGDVLITKKDGTKIRGPEIKGTYHITWDDGPDRQYFPIMASEVFEKWKEEFITDNHLKLPAENIPLEEIESIELVNVRELDLEIPRRIWVYSKEHELRFIEDEEAEKRK